MMPLQPFKLRFVSQVLHLARQHQQFRHVILLNLQIRNRGRYEAAQNFFLRPLILFFALAPGFFVGGVRVKRIIFIP